MTVIEFIKEMKAFDKYFDWVKVEKNLMDDICLGFLWGWYGGCGCFQKIGLMLKHYFRKKRLIKHDVKPRKEWLDYLIYSAV